MNKKIISLVMLITVVVGIVLLVCLASNNTNSYEDYTDERVLKESILDMLDSASLYNTYGIDCTSISIDDIYLTDDGKAYVYVTGSDGTPYKVTVEGNSVYVDIISTDSIEAPI